MPAACPADSAAGTAKPPDRVSQVTTFPPPLPTVTGITVALPPFRLNVFTGDEWWVGEIMKLKYLRDIDIINAFFLFLFLTATILSLI